MLSLFRLGDRKSTPLAGSQGLNGPAWSPDGKYIAAQSEDGHTLLLSEFGSTVWRPVARGAGICREYWSQDSRAIYYQDCLGGNQPVSRIDIPSGATERITSSNLALAADVVAYSFWGLTPDGSLLVTQIRNNADLYAIQVELP